MVLNYMKLYPDRRVEESSAERANSGGLKQKKETYTQESDLHFVCPFAGNAWACFLRGVICVSRYKMQVWVRLGRGASAFERAARCAASCIVRRGEHSVPLEAGGKSRSARRVGFCYSGRIKLETALC